MPDISDAQLAEFQQAHALLKTLYADSDVGLDFKKLVKKKFPNTSVPELDVLAQAEKLGVDLTKKTDEVSTSVTKKIDDFLAAQKKKEEDAEVNNFSKKIEDLVKTRGYTSEGKEKILALMKERGINDPEDAAILFESRMPKDAPKARQFSTRMNFIQQQGDDDKDFKALMDDPEQYAADKMLETIHELQQKEE